MKCWNCNAQGHVAKDRSKKKPSLSPVESQAPSSVVTPCVTGETTLSGFFLAAFEEEAELNRLESRTAGVLVTGIDSGTARSVVLAGDIPGYPVEKDRSCVHLRHWRVRARPGTTADPGHRRRQSARLHMRVAEVPKSLTSVCDMCAAGHRVVFDFDNDKNDLGHKKDLIQVVELLVGARDQGHPKSGNQGDPGQNAEAGCRGVVVLSP